MTFRVQSQRCSTCIYRKDSVLDIKELEEQVKDKYGFFKEHRICHHSEDVCCRGFWDKHKDEFQAGQVAQRLNLVEFVRVDILPNINRRIRKKSKDSNALRSKNPMP